MKPITEKDEIFSDIGPYSFNGYVYATNRYVLYRRKEIEGDEFWPGAHRVKTESDKIYINSLKASIR